MALVKASFLNPVHFRVQDPIYMNSLSLIGSTEYPPSLPFSFVAVFITIIGATIGSFLNVVIHRVPREQSIAFPNSRCPSCGTAIRPYDNVPILSYLLLHGRCRACKIWISPRYPAVEALTGLIFLGVFLCRGLSFALPFDLIFAAALVALVFIDAEHMILPNAITYPGMVFAVIARLAIPYIAGPNYLEDLHSLANLLPPGWPLWAVSLAGAVLGALAGGGSLWLMGWLWERLRGVEAMGLGDVKMMFAVGAYLGWRLAVLTIFIAVFVGSITGVAKMIRQRERNLQMMLPFGIFLGIGALVSLLVGSRLIGWYLGQFIF
jgi:leader peptidase (prepilin peptidase)/N-methyltransferase